MASLGLGAHIGIGDGTHVQIGSGGTYWWLCYTCTHEVQCDFSIVFFPATLSPSLSLRRHLIEIECESKKSESRNVNLRILENMDGQSE